MKIHFQLEDIGTQGFASNSKCVVFSRPPSKSQCLLESTKSIHVCVAATRNGRLKKYRINCTQPQLQKKVHKLKQFSWRTEKWLKMCKLFILERRGEGGRKGRRVGVERETERLAYTLKHVRKPKF